ncbi:polar amino acid transport system substrate-binding protein [Neisseria sp. HSC-16F19]|nr:basic amino acid ABC transporter substrate-binding protein [Neisseria sp. HSC-16F19]MCP2041285.1 polar amino acid transport system substrate-binding protein [Neisseria sp. HSC-16F19]
MIQKHVSWMGALVCACTLLLGACGGNSPSAASKAHIYTVGTNAEFAPLESLGAGGQVEGFDIDLLNAMARTGGFQVVYQDKPWESLFPGLNNGDFDFLASAITITDERRQSMDFSDPYFEISQVVLLPKGQTASSLNDLKSMKRIGVVTGNTGDLAMQQLLGPTSQQIARFESLPLVLKEIENGGVDAVVSDSAVVDNYIRLNGQVHFNVVTLPDFPVEQYGFAVRKGDTATLDMLNAALKQVRDSGEYASIYDLYFARKP